jgi:hypothetical protein
MLRGRAAIAGVALLIGALAYSRGAGAQELRGLVRDSVSRLAIPGAVVTLLDSAAAPAARTTTNERGEFRAVLLTDGARRVRVVRLGFRPAEVAVPRARDGAIQLDITLVAIPMSLQPVHVTASPRCGRRSDHTLALGLLEQARAGLLATVVARSEKPARMTRLRATRRMAGSSDRIVHQRVRIDSAGRTFGSFGAARSAVDLVTLGFTADTAGGSMYFGPDAEVLLDDGFANGYCFRVMDPDRARPNQVGLGFSPADRRRGRVDVNGALWIDTVARALVDIHYQYVGMDDRMKPFKPGGRIFFRTMPNGVVLIDQWSIRIAGVEPTGLRRLYGAEVWGELARANWPDSTTWQSSLGTLRLRLAYDDNTPATGTIVRLDDTDYQGVADSTGTVEIPDLIPGPYRVTIVDPDLASLDVAVAQPLEFTAVRDSTTVARLAVKGALEYVSQRCRAGGASLARGEEVIRGSAWILGRITNTDGEPIEGATWSLSYRDFLGERRIFENAAVGSDGIFQFCQLQRGETVVVDVRAKGMTDASATATLTRQPTVVNLTMKARR